MTSGSCPVLTRRTLLAGGAAALVAATTVRPIAAALPATPRQTEGPFYPVRLPLDADADLVRVAGSAAEAQGTVTHVAGRILGTDGRPIAGARVEIWQCDAQGIYLHPGSGDQSRRDGGFQGFGATLTDADGRYRFRTIRPVPYSGRTPHIHYAVDTPGRSRFVTQMYVAGEPGNERDVLLRRMSADQRARVLVALAPAPEIEAGALAGRFDIVIG
ncbi:MAG: intradiol ring-cleavage dioxygenase [Alphaproteobacteria bacterium]